MANPNYCVPNELVEAVFLKLPVRSLIQGRIQHFLSLIPSPRFISAHHKNSKARPSSVIYQSYACLYLWSNAVTSYALDPQILPKKGIRSLRLGLVGSANGLVCIFTLSVNRKMKFTLLNPAIKQFRRMIPFPKYPPVQLIWGFGCHSRIEDYKLFGIPVGSNGNKFKPQVFQLKLGNHREIDTCINLGQKLCSPVVVTGVWYTICYTDSVPNIFSFDLKDDSIALINPPFTRDEIQFGLVLVERNQKLCSFGMSDDHRCRGWMMVDEASWIKTFTIDLCSTTPTRIMDFLRLRSTWIGNTLLSASLRYITGETLLHTEISRSFPIHEAYEVSESLVSPISLEV